MRATSRWFLAAIFLVQFSLTAPLLGAVTNYVITGADSGPGSLRQAIADLNATGGGTILFSNVSSVLLEGELPELQGNLVLSGSASNRVVVDAGGRGRVLSVASSSTTVLRHLRITGGTTAAIDAQFTARGGGILNQGSLQIIDCVVDGNSVLPTDFAAPAFGGGIYSEGNLTIASSVVSNNGVKGGYSLEGFLGGAGRGGGIYSAGATVISNSTISYNGAYGGYGESSIGYAGGAGGSGYGGGIYSASPSLHLMGTTVALNSARGGSGGSGNPNNSLSSGGGALGGGIAGQAVSLFDCTVSQNSAYGGYPGGRGSGGQINASGTLELKCSTVVFGEASVAAGVAAPTIQLQSTIIAGNGTGSTGDVTGIVISLGHNLIRGLSAPPASTDMVGVDPILSALQDNGGPTLTHAPLAGSPTIDAGISCGLLLDQRGRARTTDNLTFTNAPGGDGTDIGAVELEHLVRPPQGTNYVTNLAASGPGSLRQAILDANAAGGGKILFSNVVGTIYLSGDLPTLTPNVAIRGPGRNLLTIDGNLRPIFTGAARQVSGLSIQRGFPAFHGDFKISDCTLFDCHPAVESFGNITILNSLIADSRWIYGSLHIYGTATVRDCTFSNNLIQTACPGEYRSGWRLGGGAILLESGRMSVSGCTFVGNVAEGVDPRSVGPGCDFAAHPALGGAIHVVQGRLDLLNCSFIGNRALAGTNGWDTPAGGKGAGGAIYVANGVLNATNCSFIANQAQGSDGRLAETFMNFFSTGGGSGLGGAICLQGGTGSFVNCTVSANCAKGGRGAVLVSGGPIPSEGGPGNGGGITAQGGTWDLIHCTIADNQAVGGPYNPTFGSPAGLGFGGGLHQSAGSIRLLNSVLARNYGTTNETPSNTVVTVSDGAGTILSQGHNLIGVTGSLTGFVASDRLNVVPLLGPLQDNGGPVYTHALLAGSPAIDAGTNAGFAFDARGQPRTIDNPVVPNPAGGDGTDTGALEVNHVLTGTEVRRAGSDMLARFTSVSDKAYGVQYRPEVGGGAWRNLPGTVAGTGGIATYTNTNAATLPRRFYRAFERTN